MLFTLFLEVRVNKNRPWPVSCLYEYFGAPLSGVAHVLRGDSVTLAHPGIRKGVKEAGLHVGKVIRVPL